MQFEILSPKKHDRISFDCGVEELNQYLQKFANQDQKRSLAKVYVLSEKSKIIGYYSISAHSVPRGQFSPNQQKGGYACLPFLLLGRLAVDKQFQGHGHGDALLFHAFKTTLQAAESIGILGIVVDAKNEKAISFYEGFGFIKLSGNTGRLFLPMETIKHLLNSL